MAAVRYFVQDVDRSIAFYTNILGFSLVQKMGPPFAILEKDGVTFWLSGPGSSAARPMPDGRKPESGGWNRLVVTVDNLEVAVRRLKEANVSFRNEPIEGPGGKQILAEDPDGNPLEIFEAR